MQKTNFIGLRVDPFITREVDKVASLYNTRRSTVVRNLLENCAVVYPITKDVVPKQDTKLLEDRVRESLKENVPTNLDPAMVEMIG